MSEVSDRPLVSIVTPSYDQGRFTEETILLGRNQDYPNTGHLIVSGEAEISGASRTKGTINIFTTRKTS